MSDQMPATPANIRKQRPIHGERLVGVNVETGEEFSVNPLDYAQFADCDDDEQLFGEDAVLALRTPSFQVLSAKEGEPAYANAYANVARCRLRAGAEFDAG